MCLLATLCRFNKLYLSFFIMSNGNLKLKSFGSCRNLFRRTVSKGCKLGRRWKHPLTALICAFTKLMSMTNIAWKKYIIKVRHSNGACGMCAYILHIRYILYAYTCLCVAYSGCHRLWKVVNSIKQTHDM